MISTTEDTFIIKSIKCVQTIIVMITILFLLVVFYPPILIYRILVRLYAHYFKPDLGQILSPLSSLMAMDDLFNKPSCVLLPRLYFDKVIDKNSIKKQFEILLKKSEYSQMMQSLTSWMLFYFWKWDKNFSLENHFKFIDEEISEQRLDEIGEELFYKPFNKNRPLWEVTYFSNFVSSSNIENGEQGKRKCVLVARFHHSLVDGFSLLYLLNELMGSNFMETIAKPSSKTRSRWEKIKFLIKCLVQGPYEGAHHVVESLFWIQGPWNRGISKVHGKYVFAAIDGIPFDEIVKTARSLEVSTPSLIYAAYSGGIRNLMLQTNMEVPRKFTAILPLPVPGTGHPGSLTNHMSGVLISVPVNHSSPLKRLMECHTTFESLKDSPLPYLTPIAIEIVGSLINAVLFPISVASAQTTNVPGPKIYPVFQGAQLTNVTMHGGIPLKICTNGFLCNTYGGNLSLKIGFDTCIYDKKETAQLALKLILNELDYYKRVASISKN